MLPSIKLPDDTQHRLDEYVCTEFKDNIAVVYTDGSTQSCLTYSELEEKSENIKNGLIEAGIEAYELVAFLLPDGPVSIQLILGVLKIPASFIFLGKENSSDFQLNLINRLQIRYMIVDIEFLKETWLQISNWKAIEIDFLKCYGIVVLKLERVHSLTKHHHNIAYAITTSGTTGQPKVVQVPHSCIVPNILDFRKIFDVSNGSRIFNAAPMTFDPSIVEIFVALSTGATLIMVPTVLKSMPHKLLDVLIKQSVTHLQVTPSFLLRFDAKILRNSLLGSDSKLKVLAFGGEQCPEKSTLSQMKHEDNQTLIYNIYGITEVSSWATCHLVNLGSDAPIHLGTVLSKTLIEVRNDESERVTEGKGKLFIGGERHCLIDNEEDYDNHCRMRDTDDEVEVLSNGLIVYLSRSEDVIKRNGKRINLKTIESLVYKYIPGIQANSVVCHKDVIHVFVKMQSTLKEVIPSSEYIKELLACHLPGYALPDKIHFIPYIPVSIHGKIDKKKLLKSLWQRQTMAPGNPTEIFTEIWEGILKQTAQAKDQFIPRGGTSVHAIQLVEEFQSKLGNSFPLLLDAVLNQNFRDIIAYIEKTFNDIKKKICAGDIQLPKTIEEKSLAPSLNPIKRTMGMMTDEHENAKRRKSLSRCDKISGKEKFVMKSYTCPECSRSCDSINIVRARSCGHILGSRNSCGDKGVNKELKLRNLYFSHIFKWKYNTEKCVDASPLIVHKCCKKVVYIGSHSHQFCAVNMKNGELLWNVALGDRIESSAASSLCGRFVIVGCYDGYVYVLNSDTGDIIWKFETGNAVKCSPIINPITGILYVGSHDQCIYALDIYNFKCIWKIDLQNGSIFSSPCLSITPYIIYVATLGGTVAALDPDTGDILWTKDIGKPIFSSPEPSADAVIVGCVDAKVYCFDHTGQKLWIYVTDGPVFSSPCAYSGSSYQNYTVIGSHDKCVHCIESWTGIRRWKFQTESDVYSSPCIMEITVNSSEHENLKQNDTTDMISRTISKGETDSLGFLDTSSAPVFAAVLVSSTEGNLYIISLDSGTLLTQIACPGQLFSSPVFENGHITVGCRDNHIYCFKLVVHVGD